MTFCPFCRADQPADSSPMTPPAPLPYLSDFADQVAQPEPLTDDQQRQMLIESEPALRSAVAEERARMAATYDTEPPRLSTPPRRRRCSGRIVRALLAVALALVPAAE